MLPISHHKDMVAARYCRASINTLRVCSSAAHFRLLAPSFVATPKRTCLFRATASAEITHTFAARNAFATMAVDTPYVTLNDGNKMPQVGFGLWKVDNDTCADTVYNAIKTGYRLFDGACGMFFSVLIPYVAIGRHSRVLCFPQSAPPGRKQDVRGRRLVNR